MRGEAGAVTGHPRRWAILSVILLALLVVVLDNTILNVALPVMERELSASQSQQEWMVDAYTLAFGGFVFAGGVLGDRFGRRRLMLIGLAVFGTSSLICSFATSATEVIVTRAVMGAGGAAMMPATLSIISNVFNDEERPRAIGVWAGLSGSFVALGPITGGVLLSHFWWGSVFLVNVPVSAVAIVLIWTLVPESRDPNPQRVQPFSVLLSVVGLVSLVYGIIKGGERGSFTSGSVVLPLLAGLVLLTVFVLRERTSESPVLDVSLFGNRTFSAGSTAISLNSFALFGATFYLTFYLQFVRDYSPLDAGLRMTPGALALMFFSSRSAWWVRRYGTRAVCATGLLLVALAFTGIHLVQADSSTWLLEALLFLQGIGMAHAFAPATAAIMSTVPRDRAGAGSAVNNTVRQVGGALGVAVIGSLISALYRAHVTPALQPLPAGVRDRAGESLGATRAAVAEASARGQDLHQVLAAARESFMHAMHWASFASACAALFGALIILVFMPPGQRPHESIEELAAEGAVTV